MLMQLTQSLLSFPAISDKDTIVITQGAGGALANGDYELCYDWGGIQ